MITSVLRLCYFLVRGLSSILCYGMWLSFLTNDVSLCCFLLPSSLVFYFILWHVVFFLFYPNRLFILFYLLFVSWKFPIISFSLARFHFHSFPFLSAPSLSFLFVFWFAFCFVYFSALLFPSLSLHCLVLFWHVMFCCSAMYDCVMFWYAQVCAAPVLAFFLFLLRCDVSFLSFSCRFRYFLLCHFIFFSGFSVSLRFPLLSATFLSCPFHFLSVPFLSAPRRSLPPHFLFAAMLFYSSALFVSSLFLYAPRPHFLLVALLVFSVMLSSFLFLVMLCSFIIASVRFRSLLALPHSCLCIFVSFSFLLSACTHVLFSRPTLSCLPVSFLVLLASCRLLCSHLRYAMRCLLIC